MGRKLRFKKIHEAQATLGIELQGAWAVNRIVSLSDQVDVLVTRERIEIHVNYALWRTIEALDERGLAISCAEIARRKWAPVSHIAQAFGVSRPTIYRWMEKLESTYVPSDERPSPRGLGDFGLSNRMVRFVRLHLDLPDDELVELVWTEFHRPIDVYGVRRLRDAVASRQRHGRPPEDPPTTQRALDFGSLSPKASGADAPPPPDELEPTDAAVPAQDQPDEN